MCLNYLSPIFLRMSSENSVATPAVKKCSACQSCRATHKKNWERSGCFRDGEVLAIYFLGDFEHMGDVLRSAVKYAEDPCDTCLARVKELADKKASKEAAQAKELADEKVRRAAVLKAYIPPPVPDLAALVAIIDAAARK